MVFKVVGGPFDGIPLDGRPPGYEFVGGAEEPTLQWVGGAVLWTLKGGPYEGFPPLPGVPDGYRKIPGSDPPTAEWDPREAMFERPFPVKDIFPDLTARYCSACGVLSKDRTTDELWVVIHRRTGAHDGHWRFYCKGHLPQTEWRAAMEDSRQPCPNCGTLMPLTGVCDFCG